MIRILITLLFSSIASASCQKLVIDSVLKAEFKTLKAKADVTTELQVRKGPDLLFHAIVAVSEDEPVVLYEIKATGTPTKCLLKSTSEI